MMEFTQNLHLVQLSVSNYALAMKDWELCGTDEKIVLCSICRAHLFPLVVGNVLEHESTFD